MNLKKARIIFMGTPFFAKEILKNLLENKVNIELVITQPDKLAGREKKPRPSKVKIFSQQKKLPLEQFQQLDQTALAKIKKFKPDLIIVAAYGMLIPADFLEVSRYGFVNIHASSLPKLRGASPIQTALLQGQNKAGITIIKINKELDSGDILFLKEITIDKNDTYPVLEGKMIKATNEFLINTLEKYLAKKITPIPQLHSEATLTKMIKKQEGKINWSWSNDNIYNQFRAFYDWPQIYTHWKNKKLALTEVSKTTENDVSKKNGEVYRQNNQVLVKTNKGSLTIKRLKLEGKKDLTIKDFLNGNPSLIGTVLK